ncbi:MAG TPA: KpsF/GutQ family sugar-phosphate isomerase [Planctomycetaceae bacterium]|nr:KpsF/GutQ family sugar-phosphate isomerase [Planctomycetaceae bacterium]
MASELPLTPLEGLRTIREVVAAEAAALASVARMLGGEAVEAAERIAACTGCVVVTGVGKAGWVGQKLVATLGSTGNRAHFLHPSEAIHGDLGRVGPDDLVIAISNSGRSEEVLKIAPHLRHHSAGLIAMTGNRNNPLAELADLVVPIGDHAEADPLGLAPTTSTTVMMAVGDAIAVWASRLVGFQSTDFARFHPGGSLGYKLAPVNRLMRPIDQCRTASATVTVRETMVVTGRTGRRTGAVMLLDAEGRIVGLFTDSDLARLLENRREDLLDANIADVMTTRFTKVQSGTLLVEAIEILRERRISELPVVDASGRPQGLLDITDVISAVDIGDQEQMSNRNEKAWPAATPSQRSFGRQMPRLAKRSAG